MKNVRRKSQSRFSLFGNRRGRLGAAVTPRRRSFRPLASELLEDRRLLAGDALVGFLEANGVPLEILRPTATPYHNPVIPTDVDANGGTELKDLLVEINALRSGGLDGSSTASGEGETGLQSSYVDVDGDNSLTVRDALQIVGALRGEAENGMILKITPEILDATTLQPITSVQPGSQFIVRILTDDLRDMDPQFMGSLGAISMAFELAFPNNVGAQFNGFVFPQFPADQFNPNATPTVIFDNLGGLVKNPTLRPGSPDNVIEVNVTASLNALTLFGPCHPGTPIAELPDDCFPTDQNGDPDRTQPPILNQVDPAVLGTNLAVIDLRFTATASVEGGLDAVNDMAQTMEDTPVIIPVLDNDTTGEIEFETRYPTFPQDTTMGNASTVSNRVPGSPGPLAEEMMMFGTDRIGVPAAATITNVSDPANGTAELLADGTIRYTPNANFFSGPTDTFTYTISNGLSSDTATVTVTVNGVNDAPIARNDAFSTQEETQLTANVLDNDTDADGDTLTVVQVNGSAMNVGNQIALTNGLLTLNQNGSFTYTPNQGVTDGTDTFTYVASDGTLTDNATVTIRIGLPAAEDDTFDAMEDMAATLDVTLNDEVNVGQVKDITAVTTPTSGTVAIVVAGGKEQILYTPAANFFGTATFTYTINDTLGEATATVTVNVANKNDPPDARNDNITVDEDTTTDLDVLSNDTFLPDPQETLTITNVTTPNRGGSASIVQGGTRIRYTPAANFFGTETFACTINDGNGGTDTATVTMTVRNVNDPPNAVNDQAQVIIAFGPQDLDVLANDTFLPDPQEDLTITAVNTAVAQPGGGQFQGTVQIINNGKAIRYTPVQGGEGTFRFEYTINDGTVGSNDTAVVTLNVLASIPSTISGFVYVDKDNDGVKDAGVDLGLGGVTVFLNGTDLNGDEVDNVPATTNAAGQYTFNNVLPPDADGYTITVQPLAFMVDGKETAGTATDTEFGPAPAGFSSTVTGNNEITVKIPILGDVISSNNNFAVRGLDPNFVGLADIIAQGDQYHGAGLAVVNQTGSMSFFVAPSGDGWEQFSDASVTLSNDGLRATITATLNGEPVESTVLVNTVLNGSGAHVKVIATNATTGDRLVRFFGSPSDFGLNGEGEGEADEFAQAADAIFAAGGV
jgi:hypothetical protein